MVVVILLLPCITFGQTFGDRLIIDKDTQGPRVLESADIDNDGYIDVLFSISNMLLWYKNQDGLGDFGEPNIINSSYGQGFDFAVGDIDSDGDQDVFYTSFDEGLVIWYENLDGQGNFSGDNIISESLVGPDVIELYDIDGDGDLDVLAAADVNDRVVWFENLDGQGNFGPLKNITFETNGRAAQAADFDGDGDLDVVVTWFAPTNLLWFENLDGSGNFGPSQIISFEGTNIEDAIVADIDNDGDIDILATKAIGNIDLFKNDGSGNFTDAITIASNILGIRALKVADLDNDGDLDVLGAANAANKFTWYENDGLGNFGEENIIDQGGIHHRDIDPADFDGDGDIDVAGIIQNEALLVWYKNNLILDISSFDTFQVTLSPNPALNQVQINSNTPINQIKIYDIQGRLLKIKTAQTSIVDISTYPVGVLFFELQVGAVSIIKQVIKK